MSATKPKAKVGCKNPKGSQQRVNRRTEQEPSVERKWWVVERQVNAGDAEDWRAPWHCQYAVGSWVGIVIQKSLVSARNSERWAARIYKGHAVRVVEVVERRTTKLRKSGACSPTDSGTEERREPRTTYT